MNPSTATTFGGTFSNSVDEKARVLLPGPWRDYVNDRVVLLCGPDGCIRGYTKETWDEILRRGVQKQSEWPTALRRYLGTATEVQREQNYRVTIPEIMLSYADLKHPCRASVTGVGVGFEIWHPDRYQAYVSRSFVSGMLAEALRTAGMPELA